MASQDNTPLQTSESTFTLSPYRSQVSQYALRVGRSEQYRTSRTNWTCRCFTATSSADPNQEAVASGYFQTSVGTPVALLSLEFTIGSRALHLLLTIEMNDVWGCEHLQISALVYLHAATLDLRLVGRLSAIEARVLAIERQGAISPFAINIGNIGSHCSDALYVLLSSAFVALRSCLPLTDIGEKTGR